MAKLLGQDSVLGASASQSGFTIYMRHQAVASGTATSIKFYVGTTGGKAKCALYADNAGSPGNVLQQSAMVDVAADGWATLTITGQAVTSGTWYWLAYHVSCHCKYASTGGTRKWKSETFNASYSFANNPSGTTDDNLDISIYADGGSPTIIPTGIASTLAFGTPSLGLVPSGIASTMAFGTPAIKLVPQGIASTLAFGVPALSVIIRLTGIASTLSFGTPAVFGGVIVVAGIASTLAFGVPEIIGGTIRPSGIASTLVFGVPTIVVYLPHRILEGSYLEESPDANYVFIVGEDATGAQVSGSSQDTTEAGLVGSRLDAGHDPAVPSATVAAAVAAARIARARLDKKRAVITIPPHCGVELWDVVSVYDTVANQNGLYRVVSYRLDYDARKSVYQHVIELSAV